MVCRDFILPEFCKPCLFLYLFQFAQLIVPYPKEPIVKCVLGQNSNFIRCKNYGELPEVVILHNFVRLDFQKFYFCSMTIFTTEAISQVLGTWASHPCTLGFWTRLLVWTNPEADTRRTFLGRG